MAKNTKITVFIIIITIVLIALVPLFMLKTAEFGGSDNAGSRMVEEVTGEQHTPWFKPIMETMLGRELPEELETLFFCIQTGIGVGIIAYCFGYLAARKKYAGEKSDAQQPV